MQRLLIILFLTLSNLALCGQSATTSPKVRDVVKKFYSLYSTDGLEYPFVGFEKKKEGWYVVTQRINSNRLEPVERFLFYDYASGIYRGLPLEEAAEVKEIDPSLYMNEYDLGSFDINYFYGYNGWYKDVITELGNRKDLTDDEIYGLARAYSSHAAGLISEQYGDTAPEEIWQLPLQINCLSPAQIDLFNSLEEKSQGYLKKLAERNPDYKTIVGKIGIKYANEIMFQYTVLLAYADDYAKKMKLPADLYPAGELEKAEKLLLNCPAGAILLSFGDNDYYPVHYLQKTKGIRDDIYLINYNLISLDRYIYRATQPIYKAAPVKLSVDTSFYAGNRNELIRINDSAYTIPFSQLMKLIYSPRQPDNDLKSFSADHIAIPLDPAARTSVAPIIALNKARYFYKNHWILLNILYNLHNRKICFRDNFIDELSGLNDHLVFKNGIYQYKN